MSRNTNNPRYPYAGRDTTPHPARRVPPDLPPNGQYPGAGPQNNYHIHADPRVQHPVQHGHHHGHGPNPPPPHAVPGFQARNPDADVPVWAATQGQPYWRDDNREPRVQGVLDQCDNLLPPRHGTPRDARHYGVPPNNNNNGWPGVPPQQQNGGDGRIHYPVDQFTDVFATPRAETPRSGSRPDRRQYPNAAPYTRRQG